VKSSPFTADNNDSTGKEIAVGPRTIILCFDGTGNKFGTVGIISDYVDVER
jgi:uncharacterized protein (DUF2235 family)